MFRVMLVLLGLLFSQQEIARNLVLIEFDSDEYETTLEMIAELEAKGVTARHIFPPSWTPTFSAPSGILSVENHKNPEGLASAERTLDVRWEYK